MMLHVFLDRIDVQEEENRPKRDRELDPEQEKHLAREPHADGLLRKGCIALCGHHGCLRSLRALFRGPSGLPSATHAVHRLLPGVMRLSGTVALISVSTFDITACLEASNRLGHNLMSRMMRAKQVLTGFPNSSGKS